MFENQTTKEHEWLQQMVGKWTFEAEAVMGPDQPTSKATGKETVRMLGANWLIGEGEGEMPCPEGQTEGGVGYTVITIGYSPEKKAMVGTWIGSMMNHMWLYEGSLDLEKGLLTLNSSGPSFDGSGMSAYRETLQMISPRERTFSSAVKGEDGEWLTFMTAVYKRVD
ncbi:DUF1579 domain-containing protein [Blastopirellula marina]|uniref:DUF1579 domain-containing protein n=1 Tax=Blastopirellula marina DSM 3645 TaxID=314230 RepID=A3ZUV4_9BACT|nr:DUF1579 domain-containing protein [Blastopirellula marina]EAQ79690.1 hypothetical protein DSM3645_24315 [Blastopirellula marina DSM 3645]